ncbi:MAG: cell division protein FtsX [Bacteroidales bacterium]|nr:cell division protein FtsX [Bacteroidales bacterium]MBN2818069.1 cell division protein FtsX [Bacteroidales bacterium]
MPKNQAKVEQRRLRSSYITSTLSISLLLLLLGLVGLLLLKTNQLSNYVKENIHFKVILNDNVPEVEIFRIQKSLDARPYVKETKYINKEAAAVDLKESLGEDFIQTLGYNPLLPTIEVKFLASYANNDSIPVIENDLKEFEGIKEVYYQKNLIQAVNDNVKLISFYILLFSLILFLIALALISNTIRLSVYSKRFIIRTMQLVGATASYIRRPFLYRSALQGIIGALLANLFLTGLIYFMQKQVEDKIFLNDLTILAILYAIVMLIGILLNWISTYFAVTKYLHIKTDKLYT